MEAYITATQAISPQDTFLTSGLPERVEECRTPMKIRPPDYRQYFDPLQRRRMSSLVKAANVCAAECLNESGTLSPDAIIVASSLGCVEESEKFLNRMMQDNPELLTPTNFIHSNHNSLGAGIALNYRCYGYNMVYSHKSASFESALLDALMLISEGEADQVLVGGIDELTEENYALKKSIGLWKDEPFSNFDMAAGATPGSIPGEGVAFFTLSSANEKKAMAKLCGVRIFPSTGDIPWLTEQTGLFLNASGLDLTGIDLVMTGKNGDAGADRFTEDFLQEAFPVAMHGYYKHLCGEYDTAVSFGLWFASRVLKEGRLPDYARLNREERPIANVLLYHHDGLRNHSLILLKTCN